MTSRGKFSTLLIHPKGVSSAFIRATVRGSNRIQLKSSCGSFEELSRELNRIEEAYSLIIVSSALEESEARAIQGLLMEHEKTFSAPVLLLVDPNVPQGEIMTQLLTGYDGVLMQPFSVDEFEMVLFDALASKQESEEVRLKKIMKTLVQSVREAQSEVAQKLNKKFPARASLQVLKELSVSVREIPHYYYKEFFIALFREYLTKRERIEMRRGSNSVASDAPRRSSAGIFISSIASGMK